MKPALVSIVSCALLVAGFQSANAQQGTQRSRPPQPAMSAGGDMMATDTIVGDSMVLPLFRDERPY
jgi:hypothetical protein